MYGYVLADPINLIDPDGLFPRNTVDAKIVQAVQRGNIRELESLLEIVGTEGQRTLIREGIKRLSTKAGDFVSKFCKGKVNREFPKEFRDKTIAEVIQAARKGVPGAAKAKKLLTKLEFRK